MKIKRQQSTPLSKDDLHQMNQRSDRASRTSRSRTSRNSRTSVPDAGEHEALSHLQRVLNSKYTFKKARKLKALHMSPDPQLTPSPELEVDGTNDENWIPPPVEPLYKPKSGIRTSNSHFGHLRRLRSNTNSTEPNVPPITQVNDDFMSMKRTRSSTMTRQRSESLAMSNRDESASSDAPFMREMDVFEIEVLYENQRGLFLLGTGYFSFKSLLPIDPSPYTNGQGGSSPYTPDTVQPPDPLWEWVHPHMLVDMSCRRKRDEAGWEYNTWFKSTGWTQHGGPFSYVRRRRWIRLRKRPANAPLVVPDHSQVFSSNNSVKTRPRSSSQLKIPNSPTKSVQSNVASLDADNSMSMGRSVSMRSSPPSVVNLDDNDETSFLPVRPSDVPPSSVSLASSNSLINRSYSHHTHISVADPFLSYPPHASEEDQKVWDQINLRRLSRIQSACQLDRERIQLWQCWLALNKVEVLNVIHSQVRKLHFKIYTLVCYETYRKQLEGMLDRAIKSKEVWPASPFLLTSMEQSQEALPTLPPAMHHTPSATSGKFRPHLQMSPLNTPMHSRRSSISLRQS
ncbi:hypothetical protein E3P92_03950 [Wallemia ichthyophaga]|nr:hypothetical protein E3P92_03950 [Wallemia ichthyophaga]